MGTGSVLVSGGIRVGFNTVAGSKVRGLVACRTRSKYPIAECREEEESLSKEETPIEEQVMGEQSQDLAEAMKLLVALRRRWALCFRPSRTLPKFSWLRRISD
ncbi:unnamed protein product [Linum trigynum]|uniref:Uncharacterized protein n=1 Tax=Linum trigynum TaxID=586398 RepID=A0AAV2EC42_9ROSI